MYYIYLQDALMSKLGVQDLRSWQRPPWRAILDGGDVFVTAPTGGGKSLLYQLPALIGDGLTLVISPTRSLQVDQVIYLKEVGVRAEFLNSDLPKAERRIILEQLPAINLLYLAPEQLKSPDLMAALKNCRVARLVVDEAHILPEAMNSFRKAYGKIGNFLSSLPERPQVIACTATASRKTRRRILKALDIPDATVFTFPIRRDNLHLSVKKIEASKTNSARDIMFQAVERELKKWKNGSTRKKRGSVIIYCTTVKPRPYPATVTFLPALTPRSDHSNCKTSDLTI